MDCGGMSACLIGKKERKSSRSFDLLSPLFLMVLMQGYQSLIMSDPASKLFNFISVQYMSIYKLDDICTLNITWLQKLSASVA